MERMASEKLIADIIQPNNSSFSSHVLLVMKKDDNWLFCVDYRELNKVTIPNKYPFPVIQEMLEELSSAQIC